MLGSDELDRYFPDRKLRLFVGSWNMNGQTPPAYLADFLLPQHIEYVPGDNSIDTMYYGERGNIAKINLFAL
jgi:hypothetical protein